MLPEEIRYNSLPLLPAISLFFISPSEIDTFLKVWKDIRKFYVEQVYMEQQRYFYCSKQNSFQHTECYIHCFIYEQKIMVVRFAVVLFYLRN